MASKAEGRSVRLAKRRRQSQAKRYLSIAAILGGAGLFVAAVISLRSGPSLQSTSFDYGPNDIAYDRPVEAFHEMEAGPQSPFLPEDGTQPQID